MKTKLILSICFIANILFVSCQQNDLLYSCDPLADEWVKRNLDKTVSMSRNEWLKLDVDMSTKKAAYVSFTPINKKHFWVDKITEVIEKFQWNTKELNHLNLLLEYIENIDIFKNTSLYNDEFELFAYKWQEDAIDNLGWTKRTVYAIAGNGDELMSKAGDLRTPYTHLDIQYEGGGKDSNSCACSSISDMCDIFGEIPSNVVSCNRNNSNCKITDDGCGLLWLFSCDGICSTPL